MIAKRNPANLPSPTVDGFIADCNPSDDGKTLIVTMHAAVGGIYGAPTAWPDGLSLGMTLRNAAMMGDEVRLTITPTDGPLDGIIRQVETLRWGGVQLPLPDNGA